MITKFVTSEDGTRIAVRLDGDDTRPVLLTIPPAATALPTDLLPVDPYEPYKSRRSWVSYDRRGTAASQRDVTNVDLDAQLRDVEAIMRDLSIETCDITAYFDGTPIAIAFAARHPDRVRRMVLWQPFTVGKDVLPAARIDSLVTLPGSDWPLAARTLANLWLPRGPVELQRVLARSFRERLSPDVFVRYMEQYLTIDVREDARRVAAETLVLHPAGSGVSSRPPQDVAALIPNAVLQHIEQTPSFITSEAVIGRIVDFLDGVRVGATSSGLPSTHGTVVILFADIVDSTAMTERLGDAAFRVKSRELDGALRTIIGECGGSVIDAKTLGDGVLATFPAASQGIAAALQMEGAATTSGLQLHVGLHAGDVIREDGNVFGGAVNIAARISSLSAAGEVLVSATVRGLARTSAGVAFEDRGEQPLKGVAEPVRLFAVRTEGVV